MSVGPADLAVTFTQAGESQSRLLAWMRGFLCAPHLSPAFSLLREVILPFYVLTVYPTNNISSLRLFCVFASHLKFFVNIILYKGHFLFLYKGHLVKVFKVSN